MHTLRLLAAIFLMGLPLSAAHADIATDDTGEEEDDKGCATVVAPASAASLALGLGIVFFQRRRDVDA